VKILMLTSHYHPTPGGSERQAHQLARSLVARGHGVRVLTMQCGNHPVVSTLDGVRIYRSIHAVKRGVLFGVSYLLTSIGGIVRLGRDADIVHAHHLYLDAIAAAAVGRPLRASTLAKVACGGSGGDLSRLNRTAGVGLVRRLLRRLDRVVTPSRQTETEICHAGFPAHRVIRIPNGVDTARFHPAGPSAADGGPRTVLFLGRLEQQKGIDTLLDAWAEIAPRLPGTTLAIGGDGAQARALLAKAEGLGVADRVQFLGAVPNPEEHLRRASAFVLPSRYEGLPNALLEAMATGLPTVATAIGGTLDVATDEAQALMVPPDDSAALAKALHRVLTDADLGRRLGVAARNRVVAEFSLDRMVTRYERLYREMQHAA